MVEATEAEPMTFTVGEVAGMFLGISSSWLRYRERQGVIPNAPKDGRDRAYTLDDIAAIGDALLGAGLIDEQGRQHLERRIFATSDWLAAMAENPVAVRDPAGRGPESGGAYADRVVDFPEGAAKVVGEPDGRWSWACALCDGRSRIRWPSHEREKAERACHMHNVNTHDPRTA